MGGKLEIFSSISSDLFLSSSKEQKRKRRALDAILLWGASPNFSDALFESQWGSFSSALVTPLLLHFTLQIICMYYTLHGGNIVCVFSHNILHYGLWLVVWRNHVYSSLKSPSLFLSHHLTEENKPEANNKKAFFSLNEIPFFVQRSCFLFIQSQKIYKKNGLLTSTLCSNLR